MPVRVTKRNHPRRTETHFFQLFNLNFAFLTIFCSQLLSYYQLILAYKIVKVIWRQFTALSPDCTKTHTLESVTILCNNISIILCTSSTVWDNRLFPLFAPFFSDLIHFLELQCIDLFQLIFSAPFLYLFILTFPPISAISAYLSFKFSFMAYWTKEVCTIVFHR